MGVLFGHVAQRHQVRMAEQRVVVEADLRVEHPQLAVLHHDQRVDLEQAHVLLDEGLVERREQVAHPWPRRPSSFSAAASAATVDAAVTPVSGSMATVTIFSGVSWATVLDVHAAFGRDDERHAADRAVDQQRQIELARDVGAVLDVEAVDLLAGRAGLLGDQRVAEHLLGVGAHLGHRLRQPDAALGVGAELLEPALAAAAGMDLALDHIERAGQLLGRGFRLVARERDALGDRQAELLEQRLGLIFVDVHARAGSYLLGRPSVQAQMRHDLAGLAQACTAATDLSNMLLLAPVELDLDDALDAAGADHRRHADIGVLDAVFAVEMRGAGQHALLVLEIGFGHRDRRSRRGVIGRAGLQQADDLGAAVAGALDDLRRASPGWSSPSRRGRAAGCRRPSNSGPAAPCVAVAAEHEGGHVLDRNLEFFGEEIAEARRVEHAGHADDLVVGRPENFCSAHTMASSGLVMQMTKAFGAYFLMPAPTCS